MLLGQLGWTEIPVTVVDLLQAARGEAHENFIRKDLLPSEIAALKRAIEPLKRREARERQRHKGDLCPSTTVAEGQARSHGEARDKIARLPRGRANDCQTRRGRGRGR